MCACVGACVCVWVWKRVWVTKGGCVCRSGVCMFACVTARVCLCGCV